MLNINGYKITEQIFKSNTSTICKGLRLSDNTCVILKFLNNDYPAPEKLAGFKREYHIAEKINESKTIKVYDLVDINNRLVIVMEDTGGRSLDIILKSENLSISTRLQLSISFTDAIFQVHSHGVIHKNINPSNIIWNSQTNELRIIDFEIATELSKEKFLDTSCSYGTIPYISPEQTGKVNRAVDYRSDFYSLGITLYEIFTGRKPFDGDDSYIIYSHIAKVPAAPCSLNADIPRAVSDIIMKLLSKNADDRYQSIIGIKNDLTFCFHNIDNVDSLLDFKIGTNDISDRFYIPQKLYGREKELAKIVNIVDKSLNKSARFLLISGYSGIGKTSVVKEASKLLVDKNVFFTSAKFNQFESNCPYIGLVSALKGLIEHLFLEFKNIGIWKSRISEALGTNAKILCDLIPELKTIIGEQPEVRSVGPAEEKKRMQMAFHDFIRVFAKKRHPLIIFFDDLQWCDLSTIDFLKSLYLSGDLNNLLIIGACRDNEIHEGHPILSMMEYFDTLPASPAFFDKFILDPLDEADINRLVSDTLKRNTSDTAELSHLIYSKTIGNPFFVNQLLNIIYQKGFFRFNAHLLKWEWDYNEIEQLQTGSNVVDFLISRLNELPDYAIDIIGKASCFGNVFDLRSLYVILNDTENIPEALWLMIKNDIILPVNFNYKHLDMPKNTFLETDINIVFRFSHDKIQQSSYALISDSDKIALHNRIGNFLSDKYRTDGVLENNIFDIVKHLNISNSIITDKKDRVQLARLNLLAGQKARSNMAFDIANNYFRISRDTLAPDEWLAYRDQYFIICYELAETIFLSGHLKEAFLKCDNLLDTALTDIDRAKVHALRSKIIDFRGDNIIGAIDEIRTSLSILGISLPVDFHDIDSSLEKAIEQLKIYLASCNIDDLVNLPEMADEKNILIMKLLFQIQAAAFQHYPPLNFLIQLIMFNMALTYGTTDVSCKNYTECGIILGSILGNYKMAYQLNMVGFKLLDKYNAKHLESGCYYIFSTFISHWCSHYSESVRYLDLSVKCAIKTCDTWHASFSSSQKCLYSFFTGSNLNECKSEALSAIKFLTLSNVSVLIPMAEIYLHTVNQLQSGYDYEKENSFLSKFKELNNMVLLCQFGVCNLIINYILGNTESADKWNRFTIPFLQGETGFFSLPDHYMFQSLLLLRKYRTADIYEKETILSTVTKNIQHLKNWSDNSPLNFQHKYYLVSAEFARIKNDSLDTTITLYKKSLSTIPEGGFIHIKALINELIGEFWLEKDEELIARAFIREAHYLYKLWGAFLKVNLMENRYRRFFHGTEVPLTDSHILSDKSPISRVSGLTVPDLKYILKAIADISKEIQFEKLLKVIMSTVIDCTDAQLGYIILKNSVTGNLFVEAAKSGDSDDVNLFNSMPLYGCNSICHEIVLYTARSHETIVLPDASKNNAFHDCKYIQDNNIKSVLCSPVMHGNNLIGIIYLENNLLESLFSSVKVKTLKTLLSYIAQAIVNSRHCKCLEEMLILKSSELDKLNVELNKTDVCT